MNQNENNCRFQSSSFRFLAEKVRKKSEGGKEGFTFPIVLHTESIDVLLTFDLTLHTKAR